LCPSINIQMRIRDIIRENQEIFELRMSPADLRRQAAGIDAIAGMEFEIAFPNANVGSDDSDAESEMDFDPDVGVDSIDDIVGFFEDGEYNSRADLRRLETQLRSEFRDWATEQAEEEFRGNTEDIVRNYIKSNYSADQDDEDERLERAIEEENSDYENARDEYFESYVESADENEFLNDAGIRFASDVLGNYDITWPYYRSMQSSENDASEIAESFAEALDVEYNLSSKYHGASRSSSAYAIEPDSSIQPEGLEFVSPPLPLPRILDDLKKVQIWAKSQDAETNRTTGLHMNVSIPGRDFSKLDLLKLVLLLGDEYVLNQFERVGNTYADSALGKIRNILNADPEKVADVLAQLKQGLNRAANSVAFHVMQNKFVSIHIKPNYVEFRSPGGDWLNQDLSKLENTLLRFVVALDAALDPTKNQQEYYTKLYKLLTPTSASPLDQSVVDLFARASAGSISKAELVKLLRQREIDRVKTAPAAPGRKLVWKVGTIVGSTSLEVLATSEQEAKQLAQLMIPEWESSPPEVFAAEMQRVYRPGPRVWYRLTNDRGYSQNLKATSELEALQQMRLSAPDSFGPKIPVKVERHR
jgi:hypothetical protein